MPGEHARNELRKDFTISERPAISRALEMKGRHCGDWRSEDFQGGNFFTLDGMTRDLAAKESGSGNGKTYELAAFVIHNGVPELV
ncbi:MAG: hypothetical protein L0Y50_03445 [Beijerinckiaceae bacterium]|nr:hypothetical protein [Beijerinckiaceae bacterium]MCI0735320.1 hypothetical protein [Beijerinckiaceae bacterium]